MERTLYADLVAWKRRRRRVARRDPVVPRPGSFPVGKVNFLELYPMSFLEFLRAMGASRYAGLLAETDLEPLPEAIHSELVDLLRKYYFTGGMPEAVRHFAETGDVEAAREIHREILDAKMERFATSLLCRVSTRPVGENLILSRTTGSIDLLVPAAGRRIVAPCDRRAV